MAPFPYPLPPTHKWVPAGAGESERFAREWGGLTSSLAPSPKRGGGICANCALERSHAQ